MLCFLVTFFLSAETSWVQTFVQHISVDYGAINCRACTADTTQADLLALNSCALLAPGGKPYELGKFAHKVPMGTPIGVFTNLNINNSKLLMHRAPIVTCLARHTFTNTNSACSQRACLNSSENLKLEPVVCLSIDAPVMLLGNLATELGLVNGFVGTVYNILYNTHSTDKMINPSNSQRSMCCSPTCYSYNTGIIPFIQR
jgi:hypothetical protein